MLGCFFPTRVLFVDDNINYLNSLVSEVDANNVIPALFNNPNHALNLFKTDEHSYFIRDQFLLTPEDTEFARGIIDIDIHAIHKIIMNPKRFEPISVVVSDYFMPEMNGLDFLQGIQALFIKKIILTGEAQDDVAVKAFNKGLIQQFIHKQAINFTEELNTSIKEMQIQYFNDLTSIIKDCIIRNNHYSNTCLNHPDYPALLKTIMIELKIIEYYLLDEHGSYLLADSEGNLSILAVKSEESMQEYYLFSQETSETQISATLKNREKIPFFYSNKDLETPPAQWEHCLYPAKKCGEDNPFYYAIIRNTEKHLPHLKNILSLTEYLE